MPISEGWHARRHQGNVSCIILFSGFHTANSDAAQQAYVTSREVACTYERLSPMTF